jgi:hypothetical protein
VGARARRRARPAREGRVRRRRDVLVARKAERGLRARRRRVHGLAESVRERAIVRGRLRRLRRRRGRRAEREA